MSPTATRLKWAALGIIGLGVALGFAINAALGALCVLGGIFLLNTALSD